MSEWSRGENKAIVGDRQVRARVAGGGPGGDSGVRKMLVAEHWASSRKRH